MFAAGVTLEDAQQRLGRASFLSERFDDRGGEDRVESLLILPATNRTKEHKLRAVTTLRSGTVTSVVELLTPERGWTLFESLPAGAASAVAVEAGGESSATRRDILQETQMQQLLTAVHVLS